ncbi:hypothetical protein BGZ90_009732 [Linnemannia elongata]|nr:hypothetical protein BGZ90_009732 [Linnemannia elongata]
MVMNGDNPYNTKPTAPYIDLARHIKACYFPGPGIGDAFLQNLTNGATGNDINLNCVYHALSIHDRLWGFEPCHAMPSPNRIVSPAAASPASQFEIRERWFPGCHYDLGRQRFRFLQNGVNLPERLVNYFLNPLSQVIMPNDVCADLVQKWMLERIQQNDPQQRVIQNIGGNIQGLTANMANATPAACGSGDIYGNIVDYGPLGLPGGYLFRVVSKLVPRLGFVINLLTRARDREIDPGAELTRYTLPSS